MHATRRSRLGCRTKALIVLPGAVVACLVATFVTLNASPHLLLALLGLGPIGPLEDILPKQPASFVLQGESLDHVAFILPPQVSEPRVLASSDLVDVSVLRRPLIGDTSVAGRTRYLLTIDDNDVNPLLRGCGMIPSLDEGRYRNLALDFRPGGLVIYADVDLGIRRPRAGLLMLQDEASQMLSRSGVVLNGTVYDLSEPGIIARLILPTGRQVQRALNALRIVGPLPGQARISAVRFYDDTVQLQAEARYDVARPEDTGWGMVTSDIETREINVSAGGGLPDERLIIVRLDPAQLRMRVHYDPTNPKSISAWGETLNALLVVNGGYFGPEGPDGHETVGMIISGGQRWGTPLRDHAGMLAVTADGGVSVRWLRDQPYDAGEGLSQAVQSFPVLVKPGGTMGFPDGADDGAAARRTVVAQDRDGRILFMVAPRGTLSLHRLANILAKSDLSIDTALNLDGGGSTGLWLNIEDRETIIDSFTAVPSVIAVDRK